MALSDRYASDISREAARTHTHKPERTNPQNKTKQMDEEGRPVLDLGHIVHSLNRVRVLCCAGCVSMVSGRKIHACACMLAAVMM